MRGEDFSTVITNLAYWKVVLMTKGFMQWVLPKHTKVVFQGQKKQ